MLTLTPTTPVSLDLIWTLPDDLGTSAAITGYEVRYFAGTADPTDEANWITFDEDSGVPDPGTLTKGQILGLMPETAYRVQVRALGDTEAETSDWRASVQATTPAALANSAVLITNFQRALHTNNIILKDNDYATGFTTGSHDAGYRLGSIQLFFRSVTAGTFTGHDVRVYLATGLPSADSTVTVVAELASPKLIQTQGSGVMSNFTAPPNTVLASGTTYFVVVQATSPTKLPDNQIPLTIARGMGYDTVPAAGWSIANVGLTRGSTSTGAWTEHTETGSDNPNTTPMAFRINAAPINDLVFQSAEAVGNQVILTYTRDIDATSVPATGAFTVEVNRGAAVISDVELSGKQVILTLAGAGLFAGDAVVVSYTKPATNPLKDTDGGEAAELNRHEFTVLAKVAGVEITSYPGDNSTYGEGEAIQVTVTFNEPVNVDLTGGRPQLEVDLHNTANHGEFKAIYKRGSGTNKLIFEYRVVSGNATSSTTGDGVAVTANSLELNGGTITTVQGAVTVDLAHDGLAHDTDHKVDGSHSAVTRLVSNQGNANLGTASLDVRDIAQGFTTGTNETGYILDGVTVDMGASHATSMRVWLTTNATASSPAEFVRLTSPSDLSAASLNFTAPAGTFLEPSTRYWVVVEEITQGSGGASGMRSTGSAAESGLPGWAIDDLFRTRPKSFAGGFSTIGSTRAKIRVSGIPAPFEPTVRTVAITSDPGGDATYGRDDRIQVSVTFDQTVTVDTSGGTPSLTIDFHTAASGEQTANYVRGSGTKTLVFEFTVVQANTSTPGVAVKANSLAANGATIKAADGLDALLGHRGLDHDTGHKVDGSQLGALSFVSAEAFGNQVVLEYTRDLDTTSKPALGAFTVTVDGTASAINSVELSGPQVILSMGVLFPGETVTVSYDKPANNPLKDTSGNEADSLGAQTLTVTAKVTGVEITSYPGDNSTYGADEAIQVTATFSSPVNVDLTGGRPSLEVDFQTADPWREECGLQGRQRHQQADLRVPGDRRQRHHRRRGGDGRLAGAQRRVDHHRAGCRDGGTGPRRAGPRHRPPGGRLPSGHHPAGEQHRASGRQQREHWHP